LSHTAAAPGRGPIPDPGGTCRLLRAGLNPVPGRTTSAGPDDPNPGRGL